VLGVVSVRLSVLSVFVAESSSVLSPSQPVKTVKNTVKNIVKRCDLITYSFDFLKRSIIDQLKCYHPLMQCARCVTVDTVDTVDPTYFLIHIFGYNRRRGRTVRISSKAD
jgi:hypothetical protein